jgi:hypothetical protein
VLALLVLAGCGSGKTSSGRGRSTNPPQPPESSLYQADVDAFNASTYAGLLRSLSQLGQADCAVGASTDFPDETLITVISSSGQWFQFGVTNGVVEPTAIRSGSDYTTALGGLSWQEFKQQGIPCVFSDGQILIS